MGTEIMKVLVLGCGPAGLIAAHAAAWTGNEVKILSVKRLSQLFGCQYLHRPIPGIHSPMRPVHYSLRGDADEYRRKVYGEKYLPSPISPQLLLGEKESWDIRAAYNILWGKYEGIIEDEKINHPESTKDIIDSFSADLVISSIPAPSLCHDENHKFENVICWAVGDAPEKGQSVPLEINPQTVICDATEKVGWYRAARVFGYSTVEWPGYVRRPPVEGVVPFQKPLSTNCDCWAGEILRVGRMGRWQKGVLVHQVWSDTLGYLRDKKEVW